MSPSEKLNIPRARFDFAWNPAPILRRSKVLPVSSADAGTEAKNYKNRPPQKHARIFVCHRIPGTDPGIW